MADHGLPDVEVLDLFVVDDDGELVTAAPWQRSSTPPQSASEPAPDPVEPTPRSRPALGGSAPPALPVRTLGFFDVFQAVAVDPADANRVLLGDAPFAGVDGIDVDTATVRVDGPTLTWNVRLRVGPGRWRDAELLVHPSPSWVLTVVELRPTARRTSRRFVRAGVEVVGGLTAWLAAAAR